MKAIIIRCILQLSLTIFIGCISLGSEISNAQEQIDGPWTTFSRTDILPNKQMTTAIAFGTDNRSFWVVTPDGVASFDGNIWKQYTVMDGLGSDKILWFEHTLDVSSDGVLWVATLDQGVSRFDGEAWTTYTTENGLLSNSVSAVAIAPNGDLWCTHPFPKCGISHFDGKLWTVYDSDDIGVRSCNLLNIAFDPEGTLWASGANFVLRYHDETWTAFSTETGMEPAISLYMDIGSDGKIWISGGGGVSCYDGSTWTHHSFEDTGMKGIGPLAVDTKNVLWTGVNGEGVFRFDGKKWTKFMTKDGPSLDNFSSITVGPDGAIWFSTVSGLSRFQPYF